MRIGRVSSLDAERATFSTVSTNAAAGIDDVVAARLGQRREVLGAQRAQVELRRAGHDLDVPLRGAQLERHRRSRGACGRRRAEARRQDDVARRGRLRPRSGRAGRSPCPWRAARRRRRGRDLDAGQRLHGAAGGRHAGDRLQLGEQFGARVDSFTTKTSSSRGKSHRGCGSVDEAGRTPQRAGVVHTSGRDPGVCQSRGRIAAEEALGQVAEQCRGPRGRRRGARRSAGRRGGRWCGRDAEARADRGQGLGGVLAGQVHGDLTRPGDPRGAAGDERARRG